MHKSLNLQRVQILPHSECSILQHLLDVEITNDQTSVFNGKILNSQMVARNKISGKLAHHRLVFNRFGLRGQILHVMHKNPAKYHSLDVLHLHSHLSSDKIIVLQQIYSSLSLNQGYRKPS